MKIWSACFAALLALAVSSCTTGRLPAGDIEIPEYCREEIAVMQNPDLKFNTREKYEAALSLSKKIDFSYARDLDFVLSVFNRRDVRSSKPGAMEQEITFYYTYGNSYVAFVFNIYGKDITKSEVKVK